MNLPENEWCYGTLLRTKSVFFLVILFCLQLAGPIPVQGHPKQVQVAGEYEITYFSDPPDPVAGSPATLFIQGVFQTILSVCAG